MIHYHVWFSFKADIAEEHELLKVSAFLDDLKTRSLIHDYRVQRSRSSTPVLAPLHVVVSFADAEQFGRPFKEIAQLGIHAGMHGSMIQHVDKFFIDEFEDVNEPGGFRLRISGMDRIEECKKCKKPFAITGSGAPIQDYEDIECPHCGDMWGREKTGGTCTCKALTPEQENEYRSRKL